MPQSDNRRTNAIMRIDHSECDREMRQSWITSHSMES